MGGLRFFSRPLRMGTQSKTRVQTYKTVGGLMMTYGAGLLSRLLVGLCGWRVPLLYFVPASLK